ncbi:ABC transporter permease [Streptomyces sp. NPDC088794]|uniref:ABC transporter permease n=1 Tax=Streptomyces sp. NPDC088794 TaxID=3365902 RepID=UPI0038115A51
MTRSGRAHSVRLAPGDILRLGLLGIRTRRLRAALAALGISIGIATLVLVVGIPAASHRALAEELDALGPNLLRAEPMPDRDPPVRLDPAAEASVRRIGPVTDATAVANTHAAIRRSDRVPATDGAGLSVLAARTNLLPTVRARLASGHFLDHGNERFPVVVLGHTAAQRLGVSKVTPGQPVQLAVGDTWFTVIGVLQPVPLATDLDSSALVGWDAARDKLGFDGHPTVIYVRADERRLEAVRDVLAPTLYPQAPGLVDVSRPSDALAAKRATDSAFSALFLGLGAVALVVGGIGVANTMVISVLERRQEIGLRRALGANKGQIRGQFLTESVVLSGLGGTAGIVTGAAVAVGYDLWRGWPTVIPWGALAAGLGGALLVGMAAGVYPSIRAARLPPTAALTA